MATEIQKRKSDDPAVAEFLAGRPTYLFQEPAWQQVVAAIGFPTAYYCLVDAGRLVLVQPAAHMRLGFFHLLYCGLPYGSAVGDLSRYGEFVELLAGAARREGVHRLRFSHNCYDPELVPPGCLTNQHMQQVLHFAGRGEEQLWNEFKGRVRRDVRLAERRGVTVEEVTDQAGRDIIFDMYRQTMARNETYVVWQRGMVERIWELYCAAGRGEMLIARHEGEPLAAIALLYSGKHCYYFLGASSGAKRSLCPNDAVIWTGIRHALARGCEDFDFMISARDDAALIEFKDKWSTTQHPFLFYERDLNWLHCRAWSVAFKLAQSRLGGAILRRVRGS